jgi:hypothetical protein
VLRRGDETQLLETLRHHICNFLAPTDAELSE